MSDVDRIRLRVTEGGQIVIPAGVLERLGMGVGTELVQTIEGDQLVLVTAKAARRRAQELFQKIIPPGVSLSEELMAERKAEAREE